MGRAAVTPMPPVADAHMPWDVETPDPVAVIAAARKRCGDTFIVDGVDDRYLFVFSPEGVRAFYDVAEGDASKGIADWRMLRRKVPPELFDGRRTLPHDLFGRSESDVQVRSLGVAIPRMMSTLGPGDEVDVFEWTRNLGNLIGLTSWGGAELADHPRLEELVQAFETLDASEAFVRPERMREIAANDHESERESMAVAERIIAAVVSSRIVSGDRSDDLLGLIIDEWSEGTVDDRAAGAARDVVLVHLASMSNLFAAIGWAIVDVVSRPALVAAVRAGDHELAVRCALESIRLAQRSVMLRHVLRPLTLRTEEGTLAVESGVTLATLVPLTNQTSATGLQDFDPDRWSGRRLGPHAGLATKELVTTFGHGKHTCPAQSFSLEAITRTIEALVDRFDVTMVDADPRPVPTQVGGVARADGPCRMRLEERPCVA